MMLDAKSGAQSNESPVLGPSGRPAAAPQALVLICLNAMPILANASLVPSLPNFLRHFAEVPGATFWVPMIITLPTLCIGVFSAVAGVLADRWGRRRLILAALVLFVACGMAPLLLDQLHWILLARVGLGLAEACTLTAGNALMGDYFAGETRRKWLSYETILGPIVGSGVLISGGYLGTLWWRGPFALYAIGILVLIGALLLIWEPPRKIREAVKTNAGQFPWKTAALVSAGTLIAAMPFFSQNIQHGRIFASLGLSSSFEISLFAMIASAGTVIGAYTFRILPARRIEQILTLVFGLFALSFIALSFKPSLPIGTALDAVGQFAGGMCYPAVLAWALSRFPPEYRGRGVGVWSGSFYVGSFVSGVTIGVIGRFTDGFLQSLGVIGFACAVISFGLLIANLWSRAAAAAQPRATT
jgi:MFS family permease